MTVSLWMTPKGKIWLLYIASTFCHISWYFTFYCWFHFYYQIIWFCLCFLHHSTFAFCVLFLMMFALITVDYLKLSLCSTLRVITNGFTSCSNVFWLVSWWNAERNVWLLIKTVDFYFHGFSVWSLPQTIHYSVKVFSLLQMWVFFYHSELFQNIAIVHFVSRKHNLSQKWYHKLT